MDYTIPDDKYSFEYLHVIFQDMSKEFKEISKETNKRFKAIQEDFGGIGKSNGLIAEDFFIRYWKKT